MRLTTGRTRRADGPSRRGLRLRLLRPPALFPVRAHRVRLLRRFHPATTAAEDPHCERNNQAFLGGVRRGHWHPHIALLFWFLSSGGVSWGMREALLLDLVLAAIDAGVISCEADLARLYTWLLTAGNNPSPCIRSSRLNTATSAHVSDISSTVSRSCQPVARSNHGALKSTRRAATRVNSR